MARIVLEPMYSSGFQEIDDWDKESVLRKYLPEGVKIFRSDDSNILLIAEFRRGGGYRVNLLNKLAFAISKAKDFYYKFRGKKMTMTKNDADKLANILIEQSKKLEAMSVTYRVMATALLASKDDFVEVVKNDPLISRSIENPFD